MSLLSRIPGLATLTWLAVAVGMALLVPPMEVTLRENRDGAVPDTAPSSQARLAIAERFGQPFRSTAIVIVHRAAGLSAEDRAFLDRLTVSLDQRAATRGQRPTGEDWPVAVVSPSPKSATYNAVLADKLVSRDGTAALVQVRLPDDIVHQHTVHAVRRGPRDPLAGDPEHPDLAALVAAAGPPSGLSWYLTGDAGAGRDYAIASLAGLEATLAWTLGGLLVVLLLVYRSPAATAIALLTVSLALVVSFAAAAVLALLGVVVNPAIKPFLVVLLYGAGTDFCLFLFARYGEELAGQDQPGQFGTALSAARWAVMPAVLASAATVAVAMGLMSLAEFQAYQVAGPALAIGLVVVTVAALTVTPELMLLAGRWLFWPSDAPKPGHRSTGIVAELWRTIAEQPARYPIGSVFWVLVALVPPALLAYQFPPTYDSLSDLPAEADARRGAELFNAHFPRGEAYPLHVLIETDEELLRTEPSFPTVPVKLLAAAAAFSGQKLKLPTVDGRMPRPELLSALRQIDAELSVHPGVADVRSLTAPAGTADPERSTRVLLAERGLSPDQLSRPARLVLEPAMADIVTAASVPAHVSRDGRALLLEVVPKVPPYSGEAMALSEEIPAVVARAVAGTPLEGRVRVRVAGVTPLFRDLRDITSRDLRRVSVLVGAALLAILIWLLRDVALSLVLIAATGLGYLATLGCAALIGRWLFGLPGPDWKLEFFLFCILVAVGQDYNIFVVSRIREESARPELSRLPRRKRAEQAVRVAVARTGGIISCCGAVMAVTFGSLMAAPLMTMKQIGFALAFGVVLDSFVLRPLLVPAAYILLERWRSRHEPTEPETGAPPSSAS